MVKRTHIPKSWDVRKGAHSEPLGFLEDSAAEPRAELPAALPVADSLPASADLLGEPLGIRAVAALIGCSAWTIRQRYVPAGMPHLRSCPNGKLIFYRNQVIHWLLERQRKGGCKP